MSGQVPLVEPICGGSVSQRERLRSLVLLALVAIGCTAATDAPGCTTAPGRRVMLASEAVDPDVFLWDSRERLIDYTAGEWGNTRQIFSHTLLTEPGTYAVVVACFPGAAHPRYAAGGKDAVGVRLTSGRNRGRYGWILSSDAHEQRTTTQRPSVGRPHSN